MDPVKLGAHLQEAQFSVGRGQWTSCFLLSFLYRIVHRMHSGPEARIVRCAAQCRRPVREWVSGLPGTCSVPGLGLAPWHAVAAPPPGVARGAACARNSHDHAATHGHAHAAARSTRTASPGWRASATG